jgi:hypothetical protein
MLRPANNRTQEGNRNAPATTVPPTQPTVPTAGSYSPGAGGSRISPDLQNPNILVEDGGSPYQYAIGVRGRRIYDLEGNVIRYEGFKFTGTGAPEGGRMPIYFAGDDEKIINFSLEDIASIQRAMNSVGLLSDNYSPGVVDSSTRAAYANLLEQANYYGEDEDAALLRLASAGAGRRGGQLTQYRVSNEKDVKAIISRVAKQTIGRNIGEEDLTRMAQAYKELEKQTGLAAANRTEVMAAPSPEVFAQEQIEEMLPEETNARKFGSYLEAIKERYQL